MLDAMERKVSQIIRCYRRLHDNFLVLNWILFFFFAFSLELYHVRCTYTELCFFLEKIWHRKTEFLLSHWIMNKPQINWVINYILIIFIIKLIYTIVQNKVFCIIIKFLTLKSVHVFNSFKHIFKQWVLVWWTRGEKIKHKKYFLCRLSNILIQFLWYMQI